MDKLENLFRVTRRVAQGDRYRSRRSGKGNIIVSVEFSLLRGAAYNDRVPGVRVCVCVSLRVH